MIEIAAAEEHQGDELLARVVRQPVKIIGQLPALGIVYDLIGSLRLALRDSILSSLRQPIDERNHFLDLIRRDGVEHALPHSTNAAEFRSECTASGRSSNHR